MGGGGQGGSEEGDVQRTSYSALDQVLSFEQTQPPELWLAAENNFIANASLQMFGVPTNPREICSPVLKCGVGSGAEMMKIMQFPPADDNPPDPSSSVHPFLHPSPPLPSSGPSMARTVDLHAAKELFNRFVRSDIAVKAVFQIGLKSDSKLPFHFFTLCNSYQMSIIGARALIPNTPLSDVDACLPLSSYFFHLHQILGHAYLHSVIGTFTCLCQKSFFALETPDAIRQETDFLETADSRHAVEQGFEYLMKMIAVSIPEIPEEIKQSIRVVCKYSKGTKQEKKNFVLKCFLSSFICSGLSTPAILGNELSQGMKVFCSLLSRLLHIATVGPPAVGEGAEFLNNLAQSAYVQKKIDFIVSHLLAEKDEDELMQCYVDFLKIWEVHHSPCGRKCNQYTCWVQEPSPQASLVEFAMLLNNAAPEIVPIIVHSSRMGAHSLDLEAFHDLLKWVKETVLVGCAS